jgi:tRNA(Ile)-lysidine synthase
MMKDRLPNTVRAYIQAESLLHSHEAVLIALSGGADSVCLFRVLLALGYRLEAAHCNFHLRGEESDRDEQFVRALCAQFQVPLHVRDFDTAAYAAARHLSIEMAAREQRYAWFEELRGERGAAVVAVAHHRDDSVETMLLNLARGTGLHGLTGIAPRHGHIIRPLLCVGRADVLDYLQALGQTYVTDSTNRDDRYRRNLIRLRLLPLLQELNPSIALTLHDTACRLRQAEDVYQAKIEEGIKRVMNVTPQEIQIDMDALMQEPSPAALIHEILHPLGFNASQQADILASVQGQSGRRFQSAGWELVRDRRCFLLRRRVVEIVPSLQVERRLMTPDFVIPRSPQVACLDADLIREPLTVRHPQPGDRFVPFGMRGSKLLSDYFTDRKFSAFRKQQQWVVCSGHDIVWLANERPDARFCITPHTRNIILISLQ